VPDELVAVRTGASFGERAVERVPGTTVATVDGEVYVSSDHRGTGVASVLLAEAERQVASGGHGRAWLAVVAGNARARRFYERHGWADDGLFDHHAAGLLVPAHRYVKTVRE
jgi:GNAT superfamily N-acetyltransferase